MKEEIRKRLLKTGADEVGFAEAGKIPEFLDNSYKEWLATGNHGEMQYLQNHADLKNDTAHVLAGSATVISLSFGYKPAVWRDPELPYIASYAFCDDYHEFLRKVLRPVVKELKTSYGGDWRICIDSAPISERYWALKSGIGMRGKNGAVITKKSGALNFLVEILTTLSINPDTPSEKKCMGCGACIQVCPTGALKEDGKMDARKCINYLTIEKAGELTPDERKLLQDTNHLLGCDRCLRVCPYTHEAEVSYLFNPHAEILGLTPAQILEMDEAGFKAKFKGTPLIYAGYPKLYRNAKICASRSDKLHE